MKDLLKKIFSIFIIAFLAVGFVLPVNTIKASTATFNNNSLDVKTFQISNSTNNVGTYNWAASASAVAGNDVAFLIYYHNNSKVTAENTRIRVDFPSSSSSTQTISVNIWADNATSVYDTVTLNISSVQNLAFTSGSVKWYPDQDSNNAKTLPSGQSGDEITSVSGLNIGNITGCWSSQGYLTLKAKVSNLSAPTTATYSATNISSSSATLNAIVNPNNSSTTTWFEYGTSSSSLSYTTSTQSLGSGNASASLNSIISNLSAGTTYYFRAAASNSVGTTYGDVLSFTTTGTTTTTTTTTTNVSAPVATTYSASNVSTNSATLNASIYPNNASTTAWFEYGTSNSFGYSTSTQSLGSGSASVDITSTISSLSANTTYYYRVVAQNSAGTTYGSTLSFTTYSSGDTNSNSGSSTSTNVSYSSPSVTTYSATSIASNSAVLNSVVSPNNASTTAWFEYGTSSSLGYATSTQSLGSGSTVVSVNSNLSGLAASTTYYFRAVASNTAGTVYGNILSFTTSAAQTNASAPLVTTNAATSIATSSANLNGTVNPNGSSTNVWFEYGTTSSSLNKTTGSQNINGSSYVPVTIGVSGLSTNTTYYFRPVAQNSAGTTYGAINSFVTNSTGNSSSSLTSNSKNTSVAVTRSTAFVEASQAIENLTSPNGNQASNFSDVGDRLKFVITLKNTGGTSAYNLKVSDQIPNIFRYVGSVPEASYDSVGSMVSWNVSRLKPGEVTNVYFIIEVEGGLNTTVNNQAKVYLPFANLNIFTNSVSTFISKQKPVALNFSADKNEVKAGDELNYSLTVKNTNNYPIKNILLSIGLPQNVELIDFDFNLASKNDNSLIVDLGSIDAGQQVTKKFTVKIGKAVKTNDILTTIAMVNYQDQAGNSQPVVSASVSATVISSANLAASIFGGIASFSIIDWLTLIGLLALIFVTISIARSLMKKFKNSNQ